MFNILKNILGNNPATQKPTITIEQTAALLKTSPDALQAFEAAYQAARDAQPSDDLIQVSSKDLKNARPQQSTSPEELMNRIVDELLQQTAVWTWDGQTVSDNTASLTEGQKVFLSELQEIPEEIRPQATGYLYHKQIPGESYMSVLAFYQEMMETKDPAKKKFCYNHFRQGVDMLDLDPVLYAILGMNPNAMGYWLPSIIPAVQEEGFFQIPKTHIIKVPLPLLQLSRLDYENINQTTLAILDKWLFELCHLNEEKDYFVKTGTFSSKFNFRNAKVTGAKEVREMAEYLLFLSHQAVLMATPTMNVSRYGVSTTNEWVVREYIADKEENPCIYNGMPLHTEYRVFVDFDKNTVLGIHPYWDPKVMMQRFTAGEDAKDPVMVHDAVIYHMHEETLMNRYEANKDLVIQHAQTLLDHQPDLTGQWSIDIMQNGDEFWLIDMAVAENSAFYEESVPAQLRAPRKENWLPELNK